MPSQPWQHPAIDMAAFLTQITSLLAPLQTQLASQQASLALIPSLQQELAQLRAEQAAAASVPPPLVHPVLPHVPLPQSPRLPPAEPAHRAAALGAPGNSQAIIDALINDVVAPGGNEVSPQHARSNYAHPTPSPARVNPLPEAFIPATIGSAQDNAQVLTQLLTTFHKKDVKYPTIHALDTALEEWAESAVAQGWSSAKLLSLFQYRNLLTKDLKDTPLPKVLDYHRLWTKAVNNGTHDMFAAEGHIYMPALLKSGVLAYQSTSSSSGKFGKKQDSPTGAAKPKDKIGSHPAGSCTKHPASTTHTTAECRLK